jgi:hypothetical protein
VELHGNAGYEGDISENGKWWKELKTDGMYQVQNSLHHRKYILYISTVSTSRSQRLTVRATTDLLLVTLQSAVL